MTSPRLAFAALLCSSLPLVARDIDPYDQSGVALETEAADPNAVKIVLVAGHASHGPGDHEFFAGTAILKKMLEQTPGVFPVMVREGWPKNPKVFEGAKAVLFYCDGRQGHPIVQDNRMDGLQKLIDAGAGWVNLHFAVDYTKGPVGDRILTWMGGYYEPDTSINPHWTADFKSLPDHPIARGVAPWSIADEWYYGIRFVPDMKGVTPILKATPPDETRTTGYTKANPGRVETVAWAYERPNGGRSFGFTGGHRHANWGDANFRRLVVNAILWSAKVEIPAGGAKVDLDPADLNRNLDDKRPKEGRGSSPPGSAATAEERAIKSPGVVRVAAPDPKPDAKGWIHLFNGKDLTGWNGNPDIWRVEKGCISGKVEKQDFNTFLIYEKPFSDFVLEADVMLLKGPAFTNSGIQYRSRVIDPAKWIVGGYQADMGDAYWGQLYEERSEFKRGVIFAPTDAALKSVKADDWNHYVVTAKGWKLRHELNGILAGEFEDADEKARSAEGVIAIQYHAPGGFEVRVKDIRVKPLP